MLQSSNKSRDETKREHDPNRQRLQKKGDDGVFAHEAAARASNRPEQ
jgi:hypothetical protein